MTITSMCDHRRAHRAPLWCRRGQVQGLLARRQRHTLLACAPRIDCPATRLLTAMAMMQPLASNARTTNVLESFRGGKMKVPANLALALIDVAKTQPKIPERN